LYGNREDSLLKKEGQPVAQAIRSGRVAEVGGLSCTRIFNPICFTPGTEDSYEWVILPSICVSVNA
jgi:hypothetical protein